MELLDFLGAESLAFVVGLIFLGKIFKETTLIKDKYIPLTLLGLSVLGHFLAFGTSVDNFIQGVITTAIAVYGNQVIKQLEKEE